ncbi:hypothetical protein [Szabonella alba]|uniref:Uncharacterized protein n=1 Tax=Szabonella alba TaxID=2804194 RepID=A0A8K0V9L1_9RHOB|nr:hypothetical protein [Szabonella alba]MBL4917992.1 hypothetical protein [Szabonella alba]
MKLTFSPTRMDATLTASVAGDVLTLNGSALDFSPLPPGATLPCAAIGCDWIAGDVTRDEAGVLSVPLILPHGPIPWPAPPEAQAVTHPEPMEVGDGPVALPHYEAPQIEEDAE